MKKSSPEHLGKKIKKLRTFNDMTQEELAAAINKTRSMVSHIERTGEANYHTLKEIAQVLNLPITQLQDAEMNELSILSEPSAEYEYHSSGSQQELVRQLKEEIIFLKSIIQNQWKLMADLVK